MDIYDKNGKWVGTSSPDTALGYQVGKAAKHFFLLSPRAAWATITMLWGAWAIYDIYHGVAEYMDYLGAVNLLVTTIGGSLIKPRALGVIVSVVIVLGMIVVTLLPNHPFIIGGIFWGFLALFCTAVAESEAESAAVAQARAAATKIDVTLSFCKDVTDDEVRADFFLDCINNYDKAITMAKGTVVVSDPLGDPLYKGTITLPEPIKPGETYKVQGGQIYDINTPEGIIVKNMEKVKYTTTFEKILFEDGTTIP